MALPFKADVDWANPAAFYLGETGMEDLADVAIKHGKLELPAHSQVLAMNSAVLRDLFRSLRSAPPEHSGQKRKRCEEVRGGEHALHASIAVQMKVKAQSTCC